MANENAEIKNNDIKENEVMEQEIIDKIPSTFLILVDKQLGGMGLTEISKRKYLMVKVGDGRLTMYNDEVHTIDGNIVIRIKEYNIDGEVRTFTLLKNGGNINILAPQLIMDLIEGGAVATKEPVKYVDIKKVKDFFKN